MTPFIYLASQSPRRRQLLDQLSVRHELLLPGTDEDAESLEAVLPREAPRSYVARVSQLKLQAALRRLKARGLPPGLVVCSDTTVALNRKIYGKPDDTDDAIRMLTELAGRTHTVFTAVVIGSGRRTLQVVSASKVTFAALTASQVKRYVASGEPMGKAGAYAVQGRAAAFITRIDGSFSGIMGLPLFETADLLRQFRYKI